MLWTEDNNIAYCLTCHAPQVTVVRLKATRLLFVSPFTLQGNDHQTESNNVAVGLTCHAPQVTIVSAEHLPQMDRFGKCDAYVSVNYNGKHGKTKHVRNKYDPEFGHKFFFDAPTELGQKLSDLEIEVMDWNRTSKSDKVRAYDIAKPLFHASCLLWIVTMSHDIRLKCDDDSLRLWIVI